MARSKRSSKPVSQRKDDLATLTTEVLQLRLQALNLPITGSRAQLIAALRSALRKNGSAPASQTAIKPSRKATGRVSKRAKSAVSRAKSRNTSSHNPPPATARQGDDENDDEMSVSSASDHEDAISDAASSAEDILLAPPRRNASASPFSEDQLSVIRETVQTSIRAAIAERSEVQHAQPQLPPFVHSTPPYRASGVATPLGLNRPLDKPLEDKILRGEYIDFCLLLPDSVQSQVPDIQFRIADPSPGPMGTPITMVRKRKAQIDCFHKWIDAFTVFMMVIVTAYPRRSKELLRYMQIISLAATKFRGLAWLSYDEQFRRRAALDLTLSWDQIDLELWAITFSGLAKPHCPHCSSPHHLQGDCPVADPSRRPRRSNSYCYDFNRPSGCSRQSKCQYPHICSRCSSNSHSFSTCPQRSISGGAKHPNIGNRSRK